MKAEQLNKRWNVALWLVFAVIAIVSFVLLARWSAVVLGPRFEVPDSAKTESYEFTDKYGQHNKAVRHEAWRHENFNKAEPVLRDEANDQYWTFKDEYKKEAIQNWPPTEKRSFWRHCFWIFWPLTVVAAALLVYFAGGRMRDRSLLAFIKRNPRFGDCTYYLNTDRPIGNREVRLLLLETCPNYLSSNHSWKFPPSIPKEWYQPLSNIIRQMVLSMTFGRDTNITYHYQMVKNYKEHEIYLKECIEYWKREAADPQKLERAQNAINQLSADLQKSFFPVKRDVNDLSPLEFESTVSEMLNKLFKDIMGDYIFKFKGVALNTDVTKMDPKLTDPVRLQLTLGNGTGQSWFDKEPSTLYPHVGACVKLCFLYKHDDGKSTLYTLTRWGYTKDFSYTKNENFSVRDFYRAQYENAIEHIVI